MSITIKKATKEEVQKAVEGLAEGQKVSYKLAETFGGEIIDIELNPAYPEKKQKKYHVYLHPIKDGKILETRRLQMGEDKAKEVAKFITNNFGSLIS